MLTLVIVGALVALASGAIVKAVTDRTTLTTGHISKREFIAGSLAVTLVTVPLITWAGMAAAKSSTLTYNEFWSGYEIAATTQTTTCDRDGSCHHTYSCDPYSVPETHTVSVPDGKGGTRTETQTRIVTKYHQCPYTTTEHSFAVSTSLGDTYTVGDHWLPANPTAHQWRRGGGLPNVPSGQPKQWAAAKARLDAGKPGGATARHTYDNYILASQRTILKKYSGAVDRYTKANLLPAVARDVHSSYLADKVYFVGQQPPKTGPWQSAMMRFNGALGTERQGDAHLVVVNTAKVSNPDEYTAALQAHWQSPAMGKDALSKNGLAVVVGTDGKTITWARSFTGMPMGNDALNAAVRDDLTGKPFDPASFLGDATVKVRGDRVAVTHGTGSLETVVFDKTDGFERVSMTGGDPDDNGAGFAYLSGEIQPTTGQKIAILAVGFVASLAIWAGLVAWGEAHPRHTQARTRGAASRYARY